MKDAGQQKEHGGRTLFAEYGNSVGHAGTAVSQLVNFCCACLSCSSECRYGAQTVANSEGQYSRRARSKHLIPGIRSPGQTPAQQHDRRTMTKQLYFQEPSTSHQGARMVGIAVFIIVWARFYCTVQKGRYDTDQAKNTCVLTHDEIDPRRDTSTLPQYDSSCRISPTVSAKARASILPVLMTEHFA